MTDIFTKTGIKILRDTKICPTDYRILIGYLDLMDEINKKIKEIESQIDERSIVDKDIELLKTIPGIGTFTAFLVKSEIDNIGRFTSKEKLKLLCRTYSFYSCKWSQALSRKDYKTGK